MRFDLKNQPAKLANFNARSELHGPDRVPAADLKIETKIPQFALSAFHEDLTSAFFRFDTSHVPMQGVERIPTAIRFPEIPAIAWDGEIVGATFTVHRGIDPSSDIVLGDCTVDKFVLEPVEGGSVTVTFRVKRAPEAAEAGLLYTLTQQSVSISVASPQATEPAA